MDDVTRAMSKGGGVLVNVLKAEGDPKGGACEFLHPPPVQEILYPRLLTPNSALPFIEPNNCASFDSYEPM